jgi:tetratricopeptide (TPR) repeat protein
MRHYARGVAYAALRDRTGFEGEMAALATLRTSGALADLIEQGLPATDLVMLAERVARGRFAASLGRHDEAIAFYRQAIEIEDGLPYQEPTFWYYPVRQSLGAALFRARRYGEASEAFRGALARAPNNGWALYGLGRSESARGRRLEAAAADRALSKAWLGDRRWLRMDRL